MKYTHLASTGIIVTGLLLATGCGSGSTGTTAPTSTLSAATTQSASPAPTPAAQGSTAGGPCDLVTSTEAEKAVGAPLGTPTVTTIPADSDGLGLSICQYPRTTGGFVLIGLYSYTGAITSALFNQFKQTKADTTPVNGVGDDAFEIKGAGSSQIIFRKGSKAAEVDLTTDTNRESNLLDLAHAAAGRL